MSVNKLYSVNEMLEMCNVTRKQLYYYEEKGLITPVRNNENNYRYYTNKERMRLFFIREYRDLGLKLKDIQSIIENNDIFMVKKYLKKAMTEARKEFEKSVLEYEKKIERYNSLLEASYYVSNSYLTEDNVDLVHLNARNIVYYEFEGTFYDEIDNYAIPYSKLTKIILENQFTVVSPKLCCFTKLYDEYGKINKMPQKIVVFCEIKENAVDCQNFTVIPAMDVLSVVHVGNYEDDLYNTYKNLAEYIKNNNIDVLNESIEEYLIDPTFSYNDSTKWCAKIFIPIK